MKALSKLFLLFSILSFSLSFSQTEAYTLWEESFNNGYLNYQQKKFALAETNFKAAIEYSKTAFSGITKETVSTQFYFATVLFEAHKIDDALTNFTLALKQAENLDSRIPVMERNIKTSIINCYFSLGQYQTSITKTIEIIDELKEQGLDNTEEYGIYLYFLGDRYINYGDTEKALEALYGAKSVFESLELYSSLFMAKTYYCIGLCQFSLGNYTLADEAYSQAFTVLENTNQLGTALDAKLRSNIAIMEHTLGNYDIAKQIHQNAMQILLDLNLDKSMDYAEELFAYARLLKDIGELDNALRAIDKANDIYQLNLDANSLKFANLKTVRAEIYLFNGNLKEALKLYEEAANSFKNYAPKTSPAYGFALNGMGTIYLSLKDYNKALQQFLLGEKELKRTLGETHKDYGITLMNIGNAYASLENFNESYPYFEKASDIIANSIGTQNTIYGQLCIGLLQVIYQDDPKMFPQFENLVDIALQIFENSTDKNNFFYNYALFFKSIINTFQGEYSEAIEKLTQAEKNIANNIKGESPIYSTVIYYLGLNYSLAKDYDSALNYFKKYNEYNIGTMLSVFTFRNHEDKQKYLKNIEFWFSDFTATALDDDFESEEIKTVTLNNQLLLKGLLLNSSKDILTELETLNNPSITSKVEQYRTLKNVLDQQKFNLQAAENNTNQETFNQLETELVELYSSKFNTSLNFQRDWKEVQKKLNNNEVAIEFVRYTKNQNTKYAAYIIKSGISYPIVVKLCNETELNKLIEKKSPNALYTSRGSQAKAVAAGTDLYNLIWKPLESHLNGIETVYYSPVGVLNQIPFTALPDENEVILLAKYNLEQLSSTYLLTQQHTESKLSSNLFIGGVKYDDSTDNTSGKGTRGASSSWNYLEGTLTEVQEIERILQDNQIATTAWIGEQATEQAFKLLTARSPSVIHIATHGFFFENPKEESSNFNPDLTQNSVYKLSEDPLMRSGLILAGANESWKAGSNISMGEDGILTALEISNLDLSKTDLVVLSACETGLGDIDGSEGVFGLQRAFKMAGVKNIIMSLWEVPDAETAEFMNSFYKNWISLGNTKAAFRSTQLEMSNKYKSEPEKWAAFVLFE